MTDTFPHELHNEPITFAKQVAQCEYYHKGDHVCGVTVFKSLPAYVTSYLVCKCEVDYRENWETFGRIGIKCFGGFCTLCGKPRPFALHRMFFTCEGCYKFFTYDFRKFPDRKWNDWIQWPLPNILCEACDVPVTSVKRTGGISFS